MIVRNAHSARVVSPCRRQTHTQTSVAARLTHLAWNASCQTSSACRSAGWSRVKSVAAAMACWSRLDDVVDLGAHHVGEHRDGHGERDPERGGAQERTAAEGQRSHPRRLGARRVLRRPERQPTVVSRPCRRAPATGGRAPRRTPGRSRWTPHRCRAGWSCGWRSPRCRSACRSRPSSRSARRAAGRAGSSCPAPASGCPPGTRARAASGCRGPPVAFTGRTWVVVPSSTVIVCAVVFTWTVQSVPAASVSAASIHALRSLTCVTSWLGRAPRVASMTRSHRPRCSMTGRVVRTSSVRAGTTPTAAPAGLTRRGGVAHDDRGLPAAERRVVVGALGETVGAGQAGDDVQRVDDRQGGQVGGGRCRDHGGGALVDGDRGGDDHGRRGSGGGLGRARADEASTPRGGQGRRDHRPSSSGPWCALRCGDRQRPGSVAGVGSPTGCVSRTCARLRPSDERAGPGPGRRRAP